MIRVLQVLLTLAFLALSWAIFSIPPSSTPGECDASACAITVLSLLSSLVLFIFSKFADDWLAEKISSKWAGAA